MCGIAGIVTRNAAEPEADLLRRMVAVVSHRGPDETGTFAAPGIGLGHARLSIIDLATGQQPMQNDDGSLWITFNGEIYNFLELRRQLESGGVRFRTRSDTEVLLRLYEARGPDAVSELNGQWAFAIWDTRRRRLFLSRDRLGVRPLHYTTTAEAFLFASEIKSLFVHPGVKRALDLRGLDQIFTFWCPVAPRTAFASIQELPPGHSLTVEAGEVKLWRYWQPGYEVAGDCRTEAECAERLRELLIDATRLRLRSDVPVGAYLSGGIDSTVTTALIKRFTDTPLRTFSVTFEDPEYDESRYQQEAVRHLDTEHQGVPAPCEAIGRDFPSVVWHAEKPMIRTAPVPLYILSGLVRRNGYKVVLTGEGSDEILGGYDIFKEAKIRRFWGRQPDSAWRPLLLKRLYPWMQNLQAQSRPYLQAFFHVRPEDLSDPFFSHLPRWELTSRIKLFYSPEVKEALRDYDPLVELRESLPAGYEGWDPFCQAQYLETTGLLPGYILSTQGDRVAMGHSVEGRYPFLDHRVVEFAASLSPRLKMKGLNEKFLLKKAAADLIPESIRRRPKQPYRAPDAQSFFNTQQSAPRFEYVREMLSRRCLAESGLFHPPAVEKFVEKAARGQALGFKDNMALVGILSTQLLMEQFIHHFRGTGTNGHPE